MGQPAARVTDPVLHPLPPVLQPGPGSFKVHIGMLPAGRGLPAAMAAALNAAKKVSDTALQVAAAATKAAMGTPAAPAAVAAEEAAKLAAAAAMSSLINGLGAAAAVASGGGTPDIHMCLTPLPAPPHGPGMVVDGSRTVLVNGLPACHMGNTIVEALGPPNKIVMGCPTVLIGDTGLTGIGPLDNLLAKLVNMLDKAGKALDAAKAMAAGFVSVVKDLAAKAVQFVKDAAIAVGKAIVETIKGAIDGFKKGVEKAAEDWRKPAAGEHHTQEKNNSCVAASIRNIILQKTGRDIPEDQIRRDLEIAAGETPGSHDWNARGTDPANAAAVLNKYGVPTQSPLQSGIPSSQLGQTTANGPVMIGFQNPGHRVILESVRTNPDGSKTYIVKDPDPAYGGKPREMSQAEFDKKYNPGAVVIVPQ